MDKKEIHEMIAKTGYCSNDEIDYAALIMELCKKPLLIEGEPGTGKTALAQAVEKWLGDACEKPEGHGKNAADRDDEGRSIMVGAVVSEILPGRLAGFQQFLCDRGYPVSDDFLPNFFHAYNS